MKSAMTRRALLRGSAGVLLTTELGFAKASQPATKVNFAVPAGACDCHTHIIGDPAKFPFAPNRIYTPETASPKEMAALHRALHIQRVVIVTPSFYGTDNSATLYGMRARGRNARGVAVIGEKTSASDLRAMDRAGFRGIRLNLATAGQNDPAVARRLFESSIERIRSLNWHIQIFATLPVIAGMKDLVASAPVPVVFDHFGGAHAALGLGQPGWADLADLVRSGKAYVKISAAYRVSAQPGDYSDVIPLARALVEANPERVLWGTDWPHPDSTLVAGRAPTNITPLLQIDDGLLLNQLAVWVPDAGVRKKILVENPARVYGF